MHELIKKSTNDYVTLLLLENDINLNTKGWIFQKLQILCPYSNARMGKSSSYLKLSLATLCNQEIGNFDASNEC